MSIYSGWRMKPQTTNTVLYDSTEWNELSIDTALLREEHHQAYGRPWILGRYQADYLLKKGLPKTARVLDFGCGSGRLAIWLAAYLEKGHYFGIEAYLPSIEALMGYELPLHGLSQKKVRVAHDSSLALDIFGVTFNWVVDCFSSAHMTEEKYEVYIEKLAKIIEPEGYYVTTPAPKIHTDHNLPGFKLISVEKEPCPLLEGSGGEAFNEWFIYQR